MKYAILKARSGKERVAIYRFRYQVFIEEQQKFYIKADHVNKMIFDEADAFADLYYAIHDGAVIGTVRTILGARGNFLQSDIDFFSIGRFETYFTHQELTVADRFMLSPEYRNTRLSYLLMLATLGGMAAGTRVCFITCLDAYLEMYLRYGFRVYADPMVFDNGMKRHKLVLFVWDLGHLEKMRSPIVPFIQPAFDDGGRCAAIARKNIILKNYETVV